MKKKLFVALLSVCVAIQSASACSANFSAVHKGDYFYEVEGDEVFFVLHSKKNFQPNTKFITSRVKIDDVDSKNFRSVPMPWRSKQIYRYGDFQSLIDIYYTDGKIVIWNGKIIENPPEYYPIDVETLKQQGFNDAYNFNDIHQYASDKNYIYYKGERTDDNLGVKNIDLENIQTLWNVMPVNEKDQNMSDDVNYVIDGKGGYFRGRYVGSFKDHKVLKQKIDWCPGRVFMIVLIDNKIFVEGYLLENVDTETFEVIEWDYYKNYLHYTDKNGEFIAEFDRKQGRYVTKMKE